MEIERTDTEVIIRLDANFDTLGLEKITRYLEYIESVKDSMADEDSTNKIAKESKKRWWLENKHRFIK